MWRPPRACVAIAYTANECCAYTVLAPGASTAAAANSRMSLLPLPSVSQSSGTPYFFASATLSAKPLASG